MVLVNWGKFVQNSVKVDGDDMVNQNDSFIDEVIDDLCWDWLFKVMWCFGWILIVLIFVVVGGVIWCENVVSCVEVEVCVWGDVVLVVQDVFDCVVVFFGIDVQGLVGCVMLGQMLVVGVQVDVGQGVEVLKWLLDVVVMVSDDLILYDMVVLKVVMVVGLLMDVVECDWLLFDLLKFGVLFELLVLEQKVVVLIGVGWIEDVIMLIWQIQQKFGLFEFLCCRFVEMMIMLGVFVMQVEGLGLQMMQVVFVE